MEFKLLPDIIGTKSIELPQVLTTGQTTNKLLLGVPKPSFATGKAQIEVAVICLIDWHGTENIQVL